MLAGTDAGTWVRGYVGVWGGVLLQSHRPLGPPPYMREIGTMCGKLAFSQGNRALFGVQNGSFSAFWHYKNKERLSRGLDVKWHIPLLVSMPPKSVFFFYWNL